MTKQNKQALGLVLIGGLLVLLGFGSGSETGFGAVAFAVGMLLVVASVLGLAINLLRGR